MVKSQRERFGNIPAQLTSFVGRRRDIVTLRRLIRANRLVTLTGPGGIGKTRLALRVASDLAPLFEHGVWLVEFASLTEPVLAPQGVATVLGIVGPAGQTPLETLSKRLSRLHLLLVLDNCEHLIDACAQLALTLLYACPCLHMLMTSRAAANVPGEVAWVVPPLAIPDKGSTLGRASLAECESVRLFVERASAARPDFTLTEENAATVNQICRQLDGMPLALELAANRVKVLTSAQLAERLDDRFRLLVDGSQVRVARHRTLQAMVDWSYNLLPIPERVLFQRLSVFSGGWTLEAAESVCSGTLLDRTSVLPLLSHLVDQSLVLVEQSALTARHRFLETLRQYASGKLLESGDAEAVQQRHLEWCQSMVEQLRAVSNGPEEAAHFDRLQAEHDNLRAALGWCSTSPDAVDAGCHMCATLRKYWRVRGYLTEGRQWLARLLAREPATVKARADALSTAGFLALQQSDFSAARPLLQACLPLWNELVDHQGLAFALRCLGQVAFWANDLATARPLLVESLRLARSLGSVVLTYQALQHLGAVAHAEGDLAAAEELLEEGLAFERERGDAWYVGLTLRSLARLALERGALTRARDLFAESLTASWKVGEQATAMFVLEDFACLAAGQAQSKRALRLAGAAAALRAAIGAPSRGRQQEELERSLASARAALGSAADSAWATGEAMTLEQAVSYALERDQVQDSGSGRHVVTDTGYPAHLTQREREVIVHLAHGLTNREIASRLVISEGTAKRHVENILAKLALSSRAEVAAWTAHHGIAETTSS